MSFRFRFCLYAVLFLLFLAADIWLVRDFRQHPIQSISDIVR